MTITIILSLVAIVLTVAYTMTIHFRRTHRQDRALTRIANAFCRKE